MPRKITPFLWFENQAEEAINFYVGDLAQCRGRAGT
jgi:predicted 3-demethylubiquinone-9 3-methyltransferase (glyoxalase superfamily)